MRWASFQRGYVMATPEPEKSARGSRTGRSLRALLDLLGRRWVLRIIWELREGALGFRALQAHCDDMSPSVLSPRLLELQAAGIVLQDEEGSYRLTPAGGELFKALAPLREWAKRWAGRKDIDPDPHM